MTHARRSAYALDEVLKQLETGRAGATRVQAGSKSFHDRYNAAKDVTDAIDELVEELTGDRERFWVKPHG
jgi:flagellin-like hook-associated protein FlgL